MNAHENKQMDDLSKKVIQKATLESPSFDFTAQIMAQLSELKQSETTIYKPLISKTAWFVIFGGFAALVSYTFFATQMRMESSFSAFDFSILTNNKVSGLFSRITFSKTLLYALAFLSVMVLVQVSFLKAYFDKRFEL